MQHQQLLTGLLIGTIVGALGALGLNKLTHQPVLVKLTGTVTADTASHEDSRLDNRVFLGESVCLVGPVYLNKINNDVKSSDPYTFIGQAVSAYGELATNNAASALELHVTSMTRYSQQP